MKRALKAARACALGVLTGAVGALALGLIALGLGSVGRGIGGGLNAARSLDLLIGGLLLVLAALMFLKGDHLPEDAFQFIPRREKKKTDAESAFRDIPWLKPLSPRAAALCVAAGFLLVGAIPDYILRLL